MTQRNRATTLSERTTRRTIPSVIAALLSGRRRTPACRAGWRRPAGRRSRGPGDRGQPALRPGVAHGHVVAAAAQLGDDVVPSRDSTATRPAASPAGRRSPGSCRCASRGVDGALEVEPADGRAQGDARKKCSCHWSCWSPPGVPNAITGTPSRSASDGVRVVRGRRPGVRELGRPGLQPGHLQPGAEREAQLGDDRVGLQPAAAGRGRDHVAPAVDDVEVAGVAAGGAVRGDGRLARPRRPAAGASVRARRWRRRGAGSRGGRGRRGCRGAARAGPVADERAPSAL